MIKKLILSGGGINGIIYLGIIKYLEENKLLSNIDTFVGSSIGAIINTLICIGYTFSELENFVLYFNFETIKNYKFENLFEKYGIDNGNKLDITLKCLIRNKLNIDDITLSELYNRTKKKNIIITSCITDNMPYYIDHTTNPSLSLVKALRMSSCIPLYFEPILYNNKYFIDGSVLNHFGIELFDNKDPEVFGVLLSEYTVCNNIKDFDTYISGLFEMILNTVNYSKCKNDNRVLIIDNMFHILNFSISKENKNELIQKGYSKISTFFKKNN